MTDSDIRRGYRAMIGAGPAGLRSCLEPDQVKALAELAALASGQVVSAVDQLGRMVEYSRIRGTHQDRRP